jgi:hypothetical protein
MIVTIAEYAKQRNCSVQNVYQQIYAGRPLPGVERVERSGKTYLLHLKKVPAKVN